jgi:hypothetical protein
MLLSLVYFRVAPSAERIDSFRSQRPGARSRASGPPPSAEGPLERRSPVAFSQVRPGAPRRGEPDPAKRAMERVHRDSSNRAAVAPGARSAQVDVSTRQDWPTGSRSGDGSGSSVAWRGRTPDGATSGIYVNLYDDTGRSVAQAISDVALSWPSGKPSDSLER